MPNLVVAPMARLRRVIQRTVPQRFLLTHFENHKTLLGTTKGARRHAIATLEMAGEMTLIEETNSERDLAQRQVARPQQVLGLFNPSSQNVLVWRNTGGFSKCATEMIGAEAGDPRHSRQGKLRREVRVNVFDGAPKRGSRHASHLSVRRGTDRANLAEKMDAEGKADRLLIEKT
jgi:hypothetical protein